MAAEIMDVIQKFFAAKSLRIVTINCRNHCLALCLPHLMKDICLGEIMGEIMNDYDTL